MASQILSSSKKKNNGPFASNWLERLRQIKRIQNKVMKAETGQSSTNESTSTAVKQASAAVSRAKVQMSDFTEYTWN